MYVKKFLEENGYRVYGGGDIFEVYEGSILKARFEVGHWLFKKPAPRSFKQIGYIVTEGAVSPEARSWLKNYTYIVVPSEFVKEKLEEVGIDSIVVPLGIDIGAFRPMGLPKLFDVLSVGIWESGFDDRKFMRKVPEICFPLSYHVHARSCARYEDLPFLYNYARVYLSPNGVEAFNIPVLEAMACGLPIVYNDAPATNEYAIGIAVKPVRVYETGGKPSYTIHEPDVKGLREAVRKVISDPKLAERLGREARRKAEQHDYRKVFRPILELLK